MKKVILSFFISNLVMFPIWIRAISFKQWSPLTKMLIMILMAAIAIGYSIYLIINVYMNPLSAFSMWVITIALVLLILATIFSVYFSWPR